MSAQPSQLNHRVTLRRIALAAILLGGTTLGGCGIGYATTTESSGTPIKAPGTATMARTLPDFTRLVAQVKPAVVSITNKVNSAAAELSSSQDELP